jgi:hypothetical protein
MTHVTIVEREDIGPMTVPTRKGVNVEEDVPKADRPMETKDEASQEPRKLSSHHQRMENQR